METHDLSVKIRQYPRKGGMTWRWWFRCSGTHLDTGTVVGGDRNGAERAAKDAIVRLKQSSEQNYPEHHLALGGAVAKQGLHPKPLRI